MQQKFVIKKSRIIKHYTCIILMAIGTAGCLSALIDGAWWVIPVIALDIYVTYDELNEYTKLYVQCHNMNVKAGYTND